MPQHHNWSGKPKRAYATKAEAQAAREKYELEKRHLMNVYQCWCKAWHIGHPAVPNRVRRSERLPLAIEEALVGKLIKALKEVINE